MNDLAVLRHTSHPRAPWCVVYTDREQREKCGRAKRITKWFSVEGLARAHLKELNKRIGLVGTTGLALDAQARADFWAGRQILDAAGHLTVSFRELAEKFVAKAPAAHRSPELLGLLAKFIAEKTDVEGASEQTTINLENRLKQWWKRDGLKTVADLTKEAVEALRARQGVGTATRRNDMGAASSFCSWLVEGEHLPANPVRGMKRPKRTVKRPVIWSNAEATALLTATAGYARGRYIPAVILMLANLRPSEIRHAEIIYHGNPVVILEGDAGKMRGRANRTVPLWPAALAWLKLAGKPSREIRPLNNMGRKKICLKAGLKWVADICRHTAISNRMGVVMDEYQVAREAGTSPEVIFSRYHRPRTKAEARAFYAIKPD